MAKNDVKILGICGSPRNANTRFLLDLALKSASERKGVATEVVSLMEKTVNFCKGCFRCYNDPNNTKGCEVFRDSMDEILPKLVECDALIVASPVYFGSVTAQVKAFMDRTEPLLRYAHGPLRLGLRNKVGGGIAVGGNRNGGQETTLFTIHHFFLIHDMFAVGVGPDVQPGCYAGVAAFSGSDPVRGSAVRDAVKEDQLACRAAEILGRRVAEAALTIKAGRSASSDRLS